MHKWVSKAILAEADATVIDEPAGWITFEEVVFRQLERHRPDVIEYLHGYKPDKAPVSVVTRFLRRPRTYKTPGRDLLVGPFKAWMIAWDPAGDSAEVADHVVGF